MLLNLPWRGSSEIRHYTKMTMFGFFLHDLIASVLKTKKGGIVTTSAEKRKKYNNNALNFYYFKYAALEC